MTTVLNGLLGGLLVGLIAGVVTQLVDSDASATATVQKGPVGYSASSSRMVKLVAQVSYGCLAGGVLLVLELYVLGILGVPPAIGEALGVSIAWSTLLFGMLVGVLWVGSSLSSEQLGELFVYHLVYGIGLGLWIRVTWIT